MFDEATTLPQENPNQDPGSSKWRCSRCRTTLRGAPQKRLLDARDRWRRDWCRTCRRKTFMERE
jgi:hypothetical protein